MNITYIPDNRCIDILKMVIYAGDYVSISTITDQLGISRRSAYYDIEKINEWLKDSGLTELKRDRRKGILADENLSEQIKSILFSEKTRSFRVLSPIERERLLICLLICHEAPLYVENLMDYCEVSRNTTVNDLKNAASFLRKNRLKLSYQIKTGYRIQGDPVKMRALFFLYYPQFIDFFAERIFSGEQRDVILDNQLHLKEIEHELHSEYVSGMLPTLAVFISFAQHSRTASKTSIRYSDLDMKEIMQTNEYSLTCRHFPELDSTEKIYVALHLLGSRMQTPPILTGKEEAKAREIACMLVSSFEEISGIRYEDREEIIRALAAHLRTSLYRYRYGIQFGNPMLDSIRTEYRELFELTKAAFLRISDEIGYHVSDDEIAYLTLHFGAFLSPDDTISSPYRIMIICPNGIGTSNMIKTEVKRLVPKATEICNIPLSQYTADNDYDVIISTVPIENENRLIVVNPILTDRDRISILRRCINIEPSARIQIDAIMRIARKYIPPDSISAFESEIAGCFTDLRIPEAPKTDYGDGLLRYLLPSHLQIVSETMPFPDALIYSLRPLLLGDSITQEYVNAIIAEQTQEHHYMFLSDGLVLAHSKSENGVKKVDASMTVFQQPVTWGNGKPVSIVVALAAEDQTRHIRILNDLLEIFSKKKSLEQICAQGSYESVIHFLQKYLGDTK